VIQSFVNYHASPETKHTRPQHRVITALSGSSPKRVAVWWGEMTRDPIPWGGKVRLPQRPEVSSKQTSAAPARNRPQKTPIRGNLRLLSAYICENHVTRDPVF